MADWRRIHIQQPDVRDGVPSGLRIEPVDASILRLEGELDLATAPRLLAAAGHLSPQGDLILDLSDVSFVDSTGLQAILNLAEGRSAGRVVLRWPSPMVLKLLRVTGLDHTSSIRVNIG